MSVLFSASFISIFTLLLLLAIAPLGILITQPLLVSRVVSASIFTLKNWAVKFCSFSRPLIADVLLLLQDAKNKNTVIAGINNFTGEYLD
jgi:hypothetical protein